jgi:hypothetical protein
MTWQIPDPWDPEATEDELIEVLQHAESWEWRKAAAEHPRATERVLLLALQDPDMDVQRGAATNPVATYEVLTRAAQDPNSWVREGVAMNPSTPEDLLELLRHDENRWVREAAHELRYQKS